MTTTDDFSHSHTTDDQHGPALNYCPQCGTPLQDRHAFGRIRRYCMTCDRVVFQEHKVAVAVLVTDETHRVLLVRRAWNPHQGDWSLPAGYVDYGESPAAAAVRECREETGLNVEVERLIDVLAPREHTGGADIIIVYEGRIIDGELCAADDAAEAGLFALQELPKLAFEDTQRAIAYLQGKSQ